MLAVSLISPCIILPSCQSIFWGLSKEVVGISKHLPCPPHLPPSHFSLHTLTRVQYLFIFLRCIQWDAQATHFQKYKHLCNPTCFRSPLIRKQLTSHSQKASKATCCLFSIPDSPPPTPAAPGALIEAWMNFPVWSLSNFYWLRKSRIPDSNTSIASCLSLFLFLSSSFSLSRPLSLSLSITPIWILWGWI